LFIGRLQTERDKARVIEGLTSAAAGEGLDRATLERLMANLGSRIFLMRNVHEDAPVLLESRWCMSYLRGPLSPAQMGALMAARKAPAPAPAAAAVPAPVAVPPAVASAKTVLPAAIAQVYLPPRNAPSGAPLVYRPALLAAARLHFVDLRQKLDVWQTVRHLVFSDPASGRLRWTDVQPAPEGEAREPAAGAAHENVPADLADPKRYAQHEKDYKAFLTEAFTVDLPSLPAHRLTANLGESEGDFRIRAAQPLREKRDEAVAELRKKYAAKIDALVERERRAEAKVENEKAQLSRQRVGTAVHFGAAALSILLGRRVGGLGRATTGIGAMTRAGKEKLDVAQAGETLEAVRRQRAELESEAGQEVARLMESFDPERLAVSSVRIEPRRADTVVQPLALAWVAVPAAGG